METVVIGIIFFVILIIIIEWIIGKAIGNAVSKETGLILGIVLILLGFTLFVAIPIIIYSNKNESVKNIKLNINSNADRIYERNITPNREYGSLYANLPIRYFEDESDPIEIVDDDYFEQLEYESKGWKEIFNENELNEYIDLFEKNKLNNNEIISDLTEKDLEKLGINIMGDRKKILKLFQK
jgi:hypothetical protein